VNTGDKTRKPVRVIHGKWIGGIGLKDQLLQMYLVERKHMRKWYMKLIRRLPNATMPNAMIIYRHNMESKSISWHSVSSWWRCFSNGLPILNAKCQVAGRGKYHSAIAGKTFHPKSFSFWERISTTEEVCGRHQTRTKERRKVLLSTV
jgi:hypothetical protein